MAEGTIMVLKVDLGCERCCKKIRKLICKIPEIKEYAFHEKDNAVMIKVVCCYPEKIKTKLICKGGKIIHSIEVRAPEKPKPPADKPKPPADKPEPPADKPKPQADKPKVPVPTPVTGYPPCIYPPGVCCKPCYEGRSGGPCHHGCRIPRQPPSYDGYLKLVPSYDGWPSGCRCNRSYGCRCEFFTEENPACTIM
ncbi:protein PYRICULARIA ORYZAE RESISTANCE 21-like isoform X1 [Vitis riparia]|uniref:protein PYRICULARIA ORYZAE RESISTANCE 21-like isoform X1 n=2 Tax=Vitis riparia TaxID=96939 RepID=UPI00155A717B|nr:protein PYRICULARIA ORYZAE RESISTANCE 21-like isoform X1 [Vitis riparia]XP_034698077.1 protein PYRICULARIA ORYZAE RESISTANCE 21-like isoform X1 [Vitis riparia]